MRGHINSYKLKNGKTRYLFIAYVGNEKHIKRKGFIKKQDAEKALSAFLSELDASHGIYNDKETVKNLEEMFFINKVVDQKSPQTEARYESFKKDIINYLGKSKVRDLTPLEIEFFYRKLAKDRSLSDNTIIKVHRYFKMTLDYAVRNRIIPGNPAEFVELKKYKKAPIKVWDASKINDYLDSLKDSHLYYIIFLAATTGLRLGELLALEWADVDLKEGFISVSKSVYRLNGQTLVKQTPKTKSSVRLVPILPETVNLLKSIPIRIGAPILNYNGTHWNPKNVSKYFKHELIAHDLPIIRFHDLRHTYATLMLKAGANDLVVSKILGHSSVAFTKDVYTHPDVIYQKKELMKAAKFLRKGNGKVTEKSKR
ncbi:MAG: tyrosine-type recombinase/integrase [Clostridiaceae bacterium]